MPKKTFLRLEDEKQERIMRSAIEEFHEKGFANAKVGNIAKKADIAKGSIYQYFDDKEDFFLYAVRWTLQYFMKNIENIAPFDDMDVFEYLLSDGRQKFELLKRETTLVKFSMDFSSGRYSELTKEINEEMWRDGDAFILQLIKNGKNKGSIRQDVDDETLMLFYKGVMSQMDEIAMKIIGESQYDLQEEHYQKMDEMVKNILKLIRTGMGS